MIRRRASMKAFPNGVWEREGREGVWEGEKHFERLKKLEIEYWSI